MATMPHLFFLSNLSRWALLLLIAALMLPVLAVLASWWPAGDSGAQAVAILREMASTVLPDYVGTTLLL